MKKIALVLAALLLISGAAFAEITMGGDATISGSVSTTLGMDIQNGVWGADAETSVNIKVPFANGDATTGGDDEVYGEISFTDVGVNFQEDDGGFTDADYDGTDFIGSTSAKIVAGDIFIALNAGGYNFNNAEGTEAWDVNLDSDWYDPSLGELTFGYDDGSIKASLLVGAKSGITRKEDNADDVDYAGPFTGNADNDDDVDGTEDTSGIIFALMGGYTSDMFSMPVTVVLDPFYQGEGFLVNESKYNTIGTYDYTYDDHSLKTEVVSEYTKGILLGASIDPSLNVSMLEVKVPADFVFINNAEGTSKTTITTYEVVQVTDADGNITSKTVSETEKKLSLTGWGLDLAPSFNFTVMEGFDINLNGYIWTTNSVSEVGNVETKSDLTYFAGGLDFTLDNVVKGLVAEVNIDVDDMYNSSKAAEGSVFRAGWGVDTSFAYTIVDGFTVTIEPDFDGGINGIDKAGKDAAFLFESFDFGASFEFGPELTGIDNTTIKLAYSGLDVVSDNLSATALSNVTGAPLYTDKNDKGIVSLATTISF